MNTLDDFYRLSEILGDDLYKVANVIRAYSPKELLVETIVIHLEELEIKDYGKVISCILDHNIDTIQNAGNGITFIDEASYIRYLQRLMDYASVSYIPFVRSEDE